MKKSIKWTAAVSAAAAMTAMIPVLTVPSLAAAGWAEENNTWRYYDSDGYILTDSWRKSGDNWYYLDENGEIALDRQIDEYYVDSEGKRVSDMWVSITNDEDYNDDAPETYWYYYGSNGQLVTSKFKTIGEVTYYFDEEGRMATGLTAVDSFNYYFDANGAMKTGWIELPLENDEFNDEMAWSYFDTRGRRIENQVDKHINGGYYTFVDGVMVTGWYKVPVNTDENVEVATAAEAEAASETAQTADAAETIDDKVVSTAPAAGYQYYGADGKRAAGWMTINGIPGVSDEDENHRFYFKSGVPHFAENDIQIFGIGSDRYAFNSKGEMLTGLQKVTLEDGSTAIYYFGENGVMKVGKQTIFNEDMEMNQSWYFNTDGSNRGQGYTGIRNNVIYENGLRKEADSDLRYAPVTFEGQKYLVNASGTIQKASSASKSVLYPDLGAGYRDVRDANDTVWTVDVNGIVQ